MRRPWRPCGTGDNGRARALLTEVAAAGDSLDESMRAKVENLLPEAVRRQGQARCKVEHRSLPGRRGPGRPEAQRGGRNQDRRGPPAARNRSRQGDRDLREDHPGRAGRPGFRPTSPGRWCGGSKSRSSSPRKTRSNSKPRCKTSSSAPRSRLKRLRILEADKAKKVRLKDGSWTRPRRPTPRATTSSARPLPSGPWRSIPTSWPLRCWSSRPRPNGGSSKTSRTRADKEEGVIAAFQGVDMAAIADPEVQLRDIKYAKNFKDLTRDAAGDERQARAQKRSQGHGDRGQAQGSASRSTWTSSR